jgi:hypothetical protein
MNLDPDSYNWDGKAALEVAKGNQKPNISVAKKNK